MSFPGAPAALRGFRLQHLYTLHRLLTDPNIAGFDVQLEGSEDLEIFDPAGHAVEAVQVKSRSREPLAPSDLASAKDSFSTARGSACASSRRCCSAWRASDRLDAPSTQ